LSPDSTAWRIENIGRLDVPSADQQTDEAAHSADSAAVLWIARAFIVTVASGLAWYSWGRWGDFQIDCGRELYVPAAILH